MRHHNWQSLLLRASKSSSSDAAIVVSVRNLFLQPELQQMHLRNYLNTLSLFPRFMSYGEPRQCGRTYYFDPAGGLPNF